MGNSDNVIGYIEYLSDDGKIIGYVTPFTDVDKFRKEILKAAEVGMPITPVVFPDKLDKSLGLLRDIYWPGGFRKEKRHTYPYEIYQTNNRNFVFRNYAYAKTRMKAADYTACVTGLICFGWLVVSNVMRPERGGNCRGDFQQAAYCAYGTVRASMSFCCHDSKTTTC